MARMTAGCIPEWLSLPKLFRMPASLFQAPWARSAACSSSATPQASGACSAVTAFPPDGGDTVPEWALYRGHADLIGERNKMSRRLVNITLDNLGDLPPTCRSCVFWELDPVSKARAEASDPGLEKESWISSVLLEWGSCGKILYVDGVPAAYVLFAPPQYVPRSVAFPTSPVSADAVLLMTARVLSEFSGGGLGRMLIQGMAKDLSRRGVRAIEAFGDKQWTAPACVLPVDYLLAVGFKTIRPHHRHPRLRMELRTALTWREDVEVALERLLGSMNPERVLLRPSPAAVSSS
ncbi:MAG: hypothetical protein WAK28_21630 [Trebonia sp.]